MELVREHWPWFVAGAVLLLIAVIVVIVLVRRRRRAPASPSRPPLDLRRAWRAFRARMPREHRRVLPLFRPFVVLGAAGAGKTTLIDQRTDWRGQAALFHPSYTEDPLLQVYQAARGVVQEISPLVLGDASPRARRALLRLWRPLRRYKDPRVVAVLDAASLRSTVPDALVKLAQGIRGKVDILAEAVGRPVKVTVVLTHMDQIEGYRELADVARELELPLAFDVGALPTADDLRAAVKPLDGWLPFVLRDRSAPDYVAALTFVRELPALLHPLAVFLDALQTLHPLSPTPSISAIGFTSKSEGTGAVWNPFATAITTEEARRFRPWRRHLAAAAALVAVFAGGLWAAYSHELQAIEGGFDKVDAYVGDFRDPARRTDLFDAVSDLQASPLRRVLPSWFADDPELGERLLHDRLLRGLRAGILEPRLARTIARDDAVGALHYLTLLAAGAGNAAARTILESPEEWASDLELPLHVVRDAIQQNRRPDQQELPLDDATFGRRFTPPEPSAREHDAAELARRVLDAMAAPLLEQESVEELRREGSSVILDLDAASGARRIAGVAEVLNHTTHRRYALPWIAAAEEAPRSDRAAVASLVHVLDATDLRVTLDDPTLGGLLDAIARVQAESPVGDGMLRFREGEGDVEVDLAEWSLAVKRTRLQALLQAFLDAPREASPEMFFGRSPGYGAVRIADAGGRFFAGAGRVDGIYTARAYEEKVRPALEKLPKALEELPVAHPVRDAVLTAARVAAEEHALGYAEAWVGLYDSFEYGADSTLSLKLALAELSRPKSPLRKLLQEVARATELNVPAESELLEPYNGLVEAFAFVRSIVPKPGESSPVLDEYFSLLAKMQQELAGAPAGGGAEAEGEPTLATSLSPIGRMALAMYLDSETSVQLALEAWLTSADIPSDWESPFVLAPRIAFRIGSGEVEEKVRLVWRDAYDTSVEPLKMAFPFLPIAETAATPERVEAALHPKGAFWSTVDAMVAPLLQLRRDTWVARRSRLGHIDLPSGLLTTLNRLEPLKRRFWDAKGEPRPLVVRVRPLPLPPGTQSTYVTVMSHLQVGSTWIYGLNQRPDWAELKLEWWKPGPVSVGAAFALAGEGDKVYRGQSLQETDWGLYRILREAERADERSLVWEWRVTSAARNRSVTVAFQLDRDPWKLLGLDDTREVRR